ncbi:MAG: hypothetical protein D6707_08910 [Bacteroidetes bacterium]|nr:MAG: hypothetical protein D6707_08910 [Bacteroidota bacterium]
MRIFFCLGLVCLGFSCFSQKEGNWWFFGNGAGIHFINNKPKVVTYGKLYTEEGCSVASDKQGNLLFYSNGVKVWNREHDIMQNGTGLHGHISSTQSCVIVPMPKNENKFYIFTVAEKGGKNGLQYSIVDLTLDNGKGAVIQKNAPLLGYTEEKLEVVPHANGKDYWIITHLFNTNKFYAFLFSEQGVKRQPVVSEAGRVHKSLSANDNRTAIGYLKASHDGKMLASAVTYAPNFPIELFTFDASTGKVSPLAEIPTSGFAYGLAFSPDNKKLYASFLEGKDAVVQYDLSNFSNISAYPVKDNEEKNSYGAISLAPDGKLYVARRQTYLDVIANPNATRTSCNYQNKAVSLAGKYCVYGLPKIVYYQSSVKPSEKFADQKNSSIINQPVIEEGELCAGTVTLDASIPDAVYLWNTGETTKKIKVSKPGKYFVQISTPANIESQTIYFNVTRGEPYVNLGNDTTIVCQKYHILDAGNPGMRYKWSTGDTTQTIKVYYSDYYHVTVTNGKCWDRDTIKVLFKGEPTKFEALEAFSPENKGFNKVFDYSINNVLTFEM